MIEGPGFAFPHKNKLDHVSKQWHDPQTQLPPEQGHLPTKGGSFCRYNAYQQHRELKFPFLTAAFKIQSQVAFGTPFKTSMSFYVR